MKLQFLGTGAADWDINNPRNDIDFRRFSSLLVDDTLLIDPGPCIFEFEKTFGYDNLLSGVKDIINTHKHADHFNADNLSKLNGTFHEFEPWEKMELTDHIVYSYPSHHGTAKNPKHYVIESKADGKRFFYGCDGAWMLYDVYRALITQKLDLMIFDATIGDIKGDYRIFEHNNLVMVEQMCDTFRTVCSRFIISHMARTLHTDHETLVKRMAGSGIEVAYDNFITEI